jgi:murein endopeptidase
MITSTMDTRKFFVLPQGYEGGGYYCYGTPSEGRGQYAHPRLISLLQQISFEWTSLDSRKFGIGNISLAGGATFDPHKGHMSGLDVDVRPIRLDGRKMPCTYREHVYDREATAKLIALFRRYGDVKSVLFNDVRIPGVHGAKHHDDHFHVTIK